MPPYLMCPSNLFIDVGNSAIKWRLGEEDNHSLLIDDFNLQLLPQFNQAWVSCVAHGEILKNLKNTHFVATESQFKTLKCAYKNPDELGSDRWLAMIAAIAIYPQQNLLLIDAGSALTFDLIINNVHQGGLIMPGLSKLQGSFSQFAFDLSPPTSDFSTPFADNTQDAWNYGTLQMFFAAVDEQIRLNLQKYQELIILISGGNADIICAKSPHKIISHNNLVLDGLAEFAKYH